MEIPTSKLLSSKSFKDSKIELYTYIDTLGSLSCSVYHQELRKVIKLKEPIIKIRSLGPSLSLFLFESLAQVFNFETN